MKLITKILIVLGAAWLGTGLFCLYLTYGDQVEIAGGVQDNQKAYRQDIIDALNALIDGINNIESDQITDKTLVNDDWSDTTGDMLNWSKTGDQKASIADLNEYYCRGLNCTKGSGNYYWNCTAGEIAIAGENDQGQDVVWICTSDATKSMSMTASGAGLGENPSPNSTYYGYARADTKGGFTLITSSNSNLTTANYRKICELQTDADGYLDTVVDTVYFYHSSADVTTTMFPRVTSFQDSDGNWTDISNAKIAFGYSILETSGDFTDSTVIEELDLTDSGFTHIYCLLVSYAGYSNAGSPSYPTSFTAQGGGGGIINVNRQHVTVGYYFKSALKYNIWVGESRGNYDDYTWSFYLQGGKYAVSWAIIGD